MTFQGHQKGNGDHELDMTVSRPTVKISGGRGTLYVDVSGKAKDTGAVSSQSQVPFATLGLGGVDMKGGASPLTLTNIPATLTEQGAKAFAGYYAAGAQLDPVSLSADVRTAPPAEPAQSPATRPSTTAETPQQPGAFTDAAVDWGVRRTFREYVTGSVGQGKWTLAEGAQDGGALFRFPQGKGAYDDAKGTLDAAFAGTVQFTGAHLDLKLGKVSVKVENGKGVLTADVTTAGETKAAVALVEFDAKGLKTEGGLATLTEAPATLTEGGSQAFNSMYKAGTEMDPVSLAVALDPTAQLPALPDLGSTAPPAEATPAAPAPAPGAAAEKSSHTGLFVALAVAVLVLAGGAAFLVARKRRTAAADAGSDAGTAADTTAGADAGTDAGAAAGTDSGTAGITEDSTEDSGTGTDSGTDSGTGDAPADAPR